MAKYIATSSCFVAGRYVEVDQKLPAVIEVDDSVEPSRGWAPLDLAGQRALARLGIRAPIASLPPTVQVVEGVIGRDPMADVTVEV